MSVPRYPKYKDSGVEWLGEVPADWSVKRFQRCVYVAEGQVDPEDLAYATMSLIAPNHIEPGTGRLLGLETATEQGAESGKYLCKAGDVVYSKIRPALRKVCIAPEDGLCSADMYPLRGHSGLTNPFLFWSILSEQFSALAVLESQRVAMPKINRESLKDLTLAVPSVEEQRVIAAFLDNETAKIDALVQEQRRLMELLREKRQAVISQAVTKGLNPNAPMKDSGIEWLGEVPAHWGVLPLRRCLIEHRQGYYSTDPYVDTGVKLLRITDLRSFGRICFDECPQVEARAELEPFLLQNADFVFARTGGAGLFGLVEMLAEPVSYASYLIRFRFDTKTHPGFLRQYFLSSGFQNAVKQNIHGGVNQNIHAEDIKNQYLALPPDVEQRLIADFLDAETAKFDALTAEAQRAVDLLQERRTALISAAVTGQIDVRQLSKGKAA